MTTQNGTRATAKSDEPKKTDGAHETPGGSREQVHKLLGGFSTVMLVTLEGNSRHPEMKARPMNVVKLDENCELTFLTRVDSEKVEEAKEHGATVVAQGIVSFVTVSGRTEIVRDRARIAEVWKPAFKAWFPEGLDDPSLCALVFHPSAAEVWDSSGAKGLSYLFDVAKALLTGERPHADPSQHNKVDLRVWKS